MDLNLKKLFLGLESMGEVWDPGNGFARRLGLLKALDADLML